MGGGGVGGSLPIDGVIGGFGGRLGTEFGGGSGGCNSMGGGFATTLRDAAGLLDFWSISYDGEELMGFLSGDSKFSGISS